MPERNFTRDELREILWRDDKDSEVVLDEITGQRRWVTEHRFVFRKSGKLWETEYEKGSTECQDDERPWEHEETVACVEVEAHERTVVDYRPVPDRPERDR